MPRRPDHAREHIGATHRGRCVVRRRRHTTAQGDVRPGLARDRGRRRRRRAHAVARVPRGPRSCGDAQCRRRVRRRAAPHAASRPRPRGPRPRGPVDASHREDDVSESLELSIVIPCINEETTVGDVVTKAVGSLRRLGIAGEVVVADNGSRDRSREVAAQAGARVVDGAANMGGIVASRGTYVLMADADDSYDLSAIDPFVDALRAGNDLVMGNRFLGGVEPGAMPALHQYLGNPVLSFAARLFFGGETGDFHCGMRAFRRDRMLALDLRTTGMEFASEMVVKSHLAGYRTTE